MNYPKLFSIILIFTLLRVALTQADEIHVAARSGNLEKVKSILASDGNLVHSKDTKGNTPLHSAISKGRLNIVTFLLDQGANLEAKNKNGLTPLFQALDLSRNRIAKRLIDFGADIHVRGYLNRTLLHMAARAGNVTICKYLIAKGADINAHDSRGSTPLDVAIMSVKTKAAKTILEQGGEINSFSSENEEYHKNLHRAVHRGESDLIRVAAQLDCDLEIVDALGYSILHKASAYGRTEMIDILLNKGINPNKKTADGLLPIDLAKRYGHEDVVDLLLSKGSNKRSKSDKHENTQTVLSKSISEKEAYIWYLNHSAWAVKTKNHLLIFDYADITEKPVSVSLASGYIDPSEIANLSVTVFASHGHFDHYDSSIFKWSQTVKDIRYVFGFQPRRRSVGNYTFIGPRQTKILDGLEINTIKSTDAGVAFLVNVDGLTIYHSGDHANKQTGVRGVYHNEIDYLSGLASSVDIAFVLAGAACGGGYQSCVLEGDFYAIEKLNPQLVFPMHSGGFENVYKEFAEDAVRQNIQTSIVSAEFRGDRFHYLDGILMNEQ